MKCICLKDCQFRLATHRGQIVDLTEEDLKNPFIASHFEPLDKKEQKESSGKKDKDSASIAGLKVKLDGMRVRYPDHAGKKELEQILISASDPKGIQ